MKKLVALILLAYVLLFGLSALSQTPSDAERLRISNERTALVAGFKREDVACYAKFLVNNCLEEVDARRRDAMSDLRRQEIVLNDQARRDKGAEQMKKSEDKESPEKQQQAADRRGEALKKVDDRALQEKQKSADRSAAATNEKLNREANSNRMNSAKERAAQRANKQASAGEEVKKYQERVEKTNERQARLAKENARRAKPSADSLPIPK